MPCTETISNMLAWQPRRTERQAGDTRGQVAEREKGSFVHERKRMRHYDRSVICHLKRMMKTDRSEFKSDIRSVQIGTESLSKRFEFSPRKFRKFDFVVI